MRKNLFSTIVVLSLSYFFQTKVAGQSYDITKDRILYTIGYAHLDTEWNWDYPATINECIFNTMNENFRLFELYPDYKFNFTGSRRYNMMKEYYPELFKKVQDYVKKGRWCVSGSSVDEGEVNITSSESLVRQILYGNRFFQKELGVTSVDYMLPDCFGFLCNLPTVFNHCGLLGFSTQKLTWRAANPIPFNVGVWNGPDDKGVIAALNAYDYNGGIPKRLDNDPEWIQRIDENKQKTGYAFDYRYYGVGDQGGSPREKDIKNAEGSLNHPDGNFKVLLSSSDQMYRDITPEIRKKLPTYKGDLLLIEHSAGSCTSQAFMKRMNRKNELLAQAAEQVAVYNDLLGASKYPFAKLNASWDLVLGSQFHDILPGTSIPKAYEYAWNDEFIAANGFANVLKDGVSTIASTMDTRTQGRSVLVYNPVPQIREDIVQTELKYDNAPTSVAVFDSNGKEVLSQVVKNEKNTLTVLFLAKVPSSGVAVFDVREISPVKVATKLVVTKNSIENDYYKVTVAQNGDIASIFDKKASKEMLSAPARLDFQYEKPDDWPAWNMDWKDRKNPPMDFMDKNAIITIEEQGPVRVSLKIERQGQNSVIVQHYTLSAGEAGKRFEVTNKIDWQTRSASLKASFPFSVSNEKATYNLGAGTIARGNNAENKFEVPAKEWIDLTDKSGNYGVTIMEDCKYGSDKPNNNTLRLTLLYTPGVKNWPVYQSTQDWGIHDVKYAVYGHKGGWSEAGSPWQAKFVNQPLIAFESDKHEGQNGKSFSMISVNKPTVGVMAFKKAEDGEGYLVRFNELSGKEQKEVKVAFAVPVESAVEVNGQEQKIGGATIENGVLKFDLSHYTLRSFVVKLKQKSKVALATQTSLDLPFNADVISSDHYRGDGDFSGGQSIPAELLPSTIESEGIQFKVGNKTDGEKNAVACDGQVINLPSGKFNKVYILCGAGRDENVEFMIGTEKANIRVQAWTGYIGQHYNRILSRDQDKVVEMQRPYVKNANIAWFASHCHNAYPMKNEAYQYSYLYKYELPISAGASTITLPKNKDVKILAITVVNQTVEDLKVLQPLYDNFANNPEFKLREK